MRIHCFQNDPCDGLGSIASWISENQHQLTTTRFYESDPFPKTKDFEMLIILGGPMNIYETETYPWLIVEKQLIRTAVDAGKIILGVCLGGQLIADVLGARVYRGRHKEIGWFPIKLTAAGQGLPIFEGIPRTLDVFHWHGDTFDIPSGAACIAESEGCMNQGFVYGDRILALQFHMETTDQCAQTFAKHFSDELVDGPFIQTADVIAQRGDASLVANRTMSIILDRLSSS